MSGKSAHTPLPLRGLETDTAIRAILEGTACESGHGKSLSGAPAAGVRSLLTPGARNYWKSHNFSTLTDGLFDTVLDYVDRLPSPQCEIFFGALGGATTRPTPSSAAYPHRDAQFVMNVHGRWEDPADDDRCIGWARDFFNASAPFASGGVYVNFLTADEGDRVRTAYGPPRSSVSTTRTTSSA